MSISPEWVGIGLTAVGAAMGVGRLWQKVADHGTHMERARLDQQKRDAEIFTKLDDLAEGVNKIKGKLDLNGD